MIAVVDFLGLLIAVMAFIYLAARRAKGMRLVDSLLILCVLAMTVIIDLGNFLEWSEITPFFDASEDYFHVLVAAFWGFFIASLTQGYYERAYQKSQARYEDVVQGANSIILRWSPEGRILFLNNFGLNFFGYGEEEILGRNVMGTIVPDTETTGRDLRVMIEDLCRDPDKYLLNENENVRKDGKRVWISWTNRAVSDQYGELQEILSIGNDLTGRKIAERALKESEDRFRTVVEDQLELVVRWLPDGTCTFANTSYCRAFGGSGDFSTGKSIFPQFHPDDREKLRQRMAALSPESPISIDEYRMLLPENKVRWYRWSDRAIFNRAGQIAEIQSVGWDITKRKEAEEKLLTSIAEKEILLKEVHHRVKNNLQVISGLLNLQAAGIVDEKVQNVFRDSQNRILSMALIHQELYQSTDLSSVDFGAYIRNLSRNLLASYGSQGGKVNLEVDADSVFMVVDTAIPCGLILNELVGNALTHAFPDGNGGNVLVLFRRLEDGEFLLEVSDDGVGLPDRVDMGKTETMGLRLVSLLAESLGARVDTESREGTKMSLTFKEYFEAGTTLF